MKYFFALMMSLVGQIAGVQLGAHALEEAKTKKKIWVIDRMELVRPIRVKIDELEDYSSYKDKKKLKKLLESINPIELRNNYSTLCALRAWRKLVKKDSSVERLKQESWIANAIISYLKDEDCLNSVYKSCDYDRFVGVNTQGRHIFYLLFTMANYSYSPVMHKLWRTVGARPGPELLEYSDKKTKKFSRVVLEALTSPHECIRSDARKGLSFLWDHHFLPEVWIKKLYSDIEAKFNKICVAIEKCKKKQRRLRMGKVQERIQEACAYINRLPVSPWAQSLSTARNHQQFVDAIITTQG